MTWITHNNNNKCLSEMYLFCGQWMWSHDKCKKKKKIENSKWYSNSYYPVFSWTECPKFPECLSWSWLVSTHLIEATALIIFRHTFFHSSIHRWAGQWLHQWRSFPDGYWRTQSFPSPLIGQTSSSNRSVNGAHSLISPLVKRPIRWVS